MGIKFFAYIIFFGLYLSLLSPVLSYNEGHLESLHEQIKKGMTVQCIGFDLQDADLRDLNLKGANFLNANVKRANFAKANLHGAIFCEAQLQRADFSYTTLSGADFTRANMNGAKFCHADLTRADLTRASVEGAKFKNAQLLNIKYENVYAAKGSLFSDRKALLKKLEEAKKINDIQNNCFGEPINHITYIGPPLQVFHEHLYKVLSKMNASCTVINFNPLFSSGDGHSPQETVQDFIGFLKSPLFRPFVKDLTPICQNKNLIVFPQLQDITSKKKSFSPKEKVVPTLDLHGNIPWETKSKWVAKFVKEAHRKSHESVEIITGRGLHNPDGKMGTLWRMCEKYLKNGDLRQYIQKIDSISKDGGWKVFLKPNLKKQKKRKARSTKKLSSGYEES